MAAAAAEAAFTVEVLKSELRETDEIDKTAFTMYVLNVTRAPPDQRAPRSATK